MKQKKNGGMNNKTKKLLFLTMMTVTIILAILDVIKLLK